MSWLSGQEIEDAIYHHADKATREAFYGICSMDQLPFSVPHYPFFMIVNTQAHNLPGAHWITVFIDKNRRGEVFDSLALPLRKPLSRWINQFTRSVTRNRLTYQHPLSDTCGAFAVYFVCHRLTGPVSFSKTLHVNENTVRSFYHNLQ